MKFPERVGIPLRIIAVILVVMLAWTLRWRAVTMLPVDYDEDDYLKAAQEYATLIQAGDWAGFMDANYRPEHPALIKIAYGLAIAGDPVVPTIPDRATSADPDQTLPRPHLTHARTLGAIFGTLTVLAVSLLNPLGGLILAIHSWTIKYDSQVMLESLPALTSLMAVMLYVLYRQKGRTPSSDGRTPSAPTFSLLLAVSAIFFGLTVASKYVYGIVGIAILADWFIPDQQNSHPFAFARVRSMVLWGLLAVLVFFLADPYLWPDPVNRLKDSLLYHITYSTSSADVERANYPIWQQFVWLSMNVPWSQEAFKVLLDPFIFILGIAGFWGLRKEKRIYLLWLGLGLLFLLIWRTKWPQYLLMITVPLSLAAAEGGKVIVQTLWQGWKQSRMQKKERAVYNKRETRQSIPWLAPGLIALAALTLFPLIFQLAMSFTDFSGPSILDGIRGGVWRAVWQGFTGQVQAVSWDPFSDTPYSATKTVNFAGGNLLASLFSGLGADILVFEIIWTVLSVSLQAALGIGLALMLNRRGVRYANFWRTIFILPWAIPEFIGALVWLRTFDPTAGWVGQAFGGSIVSTLLNNGGYAISLVVLLTAATWFGFPFIMLAASASLKLVPQEVYDAAAMDGADGWNLFRHVTWPLLMPLVVPALIIRAIFAFNQFYLFFVMPTRLTTFATASYYVFNFNNQYAVSAAINVFTVVVLFALLILFNRWSKAAEGVTYA